jgi:hypothetical protein
MVVAATRDIDFWVVLGIYLLAALILAYWVPRLLGFILVLPLRAVGKARRRGQREPG